MVEQQRIKVSSKELVYLALFLSGGVTQTALSTVLKTVGSVTSGMEVGTSPHRSINILLPRAHFFWTVKAA